MLIDDLLNSKEWREAGLIEPIRKRLEKAPKFVLRRDFAMAVDEMVHNGWERNRDKIVPLCRLPYPECWIELAQMDRLAFRDKLPIRTYECPVKRIGWLLTEVNKNGRWKVEMFWSFDRGNESFQNMINGVELRESMFWVKAPLSAAMVSLSFDPTAPNANEAISPFGPSSFSIMAIARDSTYSFKLDHPGNLTDWEGEGTFLMGTLAMLHSKNVTDRTPVSFAKKNKAAVKAGQLPLFDHHVISIHQRYIKRNMDKETANDGRKFRFHFCRAHFKIRKTGVFFWHAHDRGDIRLGRVHKDYDLTT